jgi:hypothetical protein
VVEVLVKDVELVGDHPRVSFGLGGVVQVVDGGW